MARIQRVTSPKAPEPPPDRWSNCLVVDGIAYISGQTGRPGPGENNLDDYAQAKKIFEKIQALIEAAGGVMSDTVKITIFVTDIRRREDVWRARAEYFTGNFPASTLVEVSKLAAPEVTVEIDAIAHIRSSTS